MFDAKLIKISKDRDINSNIIKKQVYGIPTTVIQSKT